MEYTHNISEAARQKDWNIIVDDLDLSETDSDSSVVNSAEVQTKRQGREEAQVHYEDPEASIQPPHDVIGDEANIDGATAAPQPAAHTQKAQLTPPAAPQMVGLEAPFNAGVSFI